MTKAPIPDVRVGQLWRYESWSQPGIWYSFTVDRVASDRAYCRQTGIGGGIHPKFTKRLSAFRSCVLVNDASMHSGSEEEK